MTASEPWPVVGFLNNRGEWEESLFNPSNAEHVAIMMELTADCPECREWLEAVLPGSRQRSRARRRREAHAARGRNRLRRGR